MAFDCALDPRVEDWRRGIAAFVQDQVIPREQKVFEHGRTDCMCCEGN